MPDIDDISGSGESRLERESIEEATKAAREAAEARAQHPHIRLSTQVPRQEMFALVLAFALFGLLLVTTITPLMNPIFPLAALVFFLYPFRKEVVARRTIQLGIATYLIWLFLNLSGVLFPFIVAFVFAYLFAPALQNLSQRGVPRWVTALVVVLAMLGVYTGIGLFIVPALIEQGEQLAQSAQAILKGANTFLDKAKLARELSRLGISQQQAEDLITNQIEPQIQGIIAWIFGGFGGFVRNVTSILEGIFMLILIPALTFYMMLDFRKIRNLVRSTILQENPRKVYLVKRVDTIVNAYLRGVLITSGIVGALATIVLSIAGVPYAIVMGVITGLLNLIPTVGQLINIFVALVIYMFAPGDFWFNTLFTTGTILGLHALNGYVIEPRIIGDRVGLHPVMVIASLFIFGHFLGFIGLLIAVPATAVILMFLKEWYTQSVTLKNTVVVDDANQNDRPEQRARGDLGASGGTAASG